MSQQWGNGPQQGQDQLPGQIRVQGQFDDIAAVHSVSETFFPQNPPPPPPDLADADSFAAGALGGLRDASVADGGSLAPLSTTNSGMTIKLKGPASADSQSSTGAGAVAPFSLPATTAANALTSPGSKASRPAANKLGTVFRLAATNRAFIEAQSDGNNRMRKTLLAWERGEIETPASGRRASSGTGSTSRALALVDSSGRQPVTRRRPGRPRKSATRASTGFSGDSDESDGIRSASPSAGSSSDTSESPLSSADEEEVDGTTRRIQASGATRSARSRALQELTTEEGQDLLPQRGYPQLLPTQMEAHGKLMFDSSDQRLDREVRKLPLRWRTMMKACARRGDKHAGDVDWLAKEVGFTKGTCRVYASKVCKDLHLNLGVLTTVQALWAIAYRWHKTREQAAEGQSSGEDPLVVDMQKRRPGRQPGARPVGRPAGRPSGRPVGRPSTKLPGPIAVAGGVDRDSSDEEYVAHIRLKGTDFPYHPPYVGPDHQVDIEGLPMLTVDESKQLSADSGELLWDPAWYDHPVYGSQVRLLDNKRVSAVIMHAPAKAHLCARLGDGMEIGYNELWNTIQSLRECILGDGKAESSDGSPSKISQPRVRALDADVMPHGWTLEHESGLEHLCGVLQKDWHLIAKVLAGPAATATQALEFYYWIKGSRQASWYADRCRDQRNAQQIRTAMELSSPSETSGSSSEESSAESDDIEDEDQDQGLEVAVSGGENDVGGVSDEGDVEMPKAAEQDPAALLVARPKRSLDDADDERDTKRLRSDVAPDMKVEDDAEMSVVVQEAGITPIPTKSREISLPPFDRARGVGSQATWRQAVLDVMQALRKQSPGQWFSPSDIADLVQQRSPLYWYSKKKHTNKGDNVKTALSQSHGWERKHEHETDVRGRQYSRPMYILPTDFPEESFEDTFADSDERFYNEGLAKVMIAYDTPSEPDRVPSVTRKHAGVRHSQNSRRPRNSSDAIAAREAEALNMRRSTRSRRESNLLSPFVPTVVLLNRERAANGRHAWLEFDTTEAIEQARKLGIHYAGRAHKRTVTKFPSGWTLERVQRHFAGTSDLFWRPPHSLTGGKPVVLKSKRELEVFVFGEDSTHKSPAHRARLLASIARESEASSLLAPRGLDALADGDSSKPGWARLLEFVLLNNFRGWTNCPGIAKELNALVGKVKAAGFESDLEIADIDVGRLFYNLPAAPTRWVSSPELHALPDGEGMSNLFAHELNASQPVHCSPDCICSSRAGSSASGQAAPKPSRLAMTAMYADMWIRSVSEHGDIYFWNNATKASAWVEPEMWRHGVLEGELTPDELERLGKIQDEFGRMLEFLPKVLAAEEGQPPVDQRVATTGVSVQ